jgi:hypothetical protein
MLYSIEAYVVAAVVLSQLALLLQLKESACYFCTANQLEI